MGLKSSILLYSTPKYINVIGSTHRLKLVIKLIRNFEVPGLNLDGENKKSIEDGHKMNEYLEDIFEQNFYKIRGTVKP